jgi:hypothetical protein
MRIAMPIVALFLILFLPVCMIGCFGDTGTIQEKLLPNYSDMGAAHDAGRTPDSSQARPETGGGK